MSRYFSVPRAASWIEDDYYSPDAASAHIPSVPEHEARDTGLIDARGDAIWRAPNPLGFGRDEEW